MKAIDTDVLTEILAGVLACATVPQGFPGKDGEPALVYFLKRSN